MKTLLAAIAIILQLSLTGCATLGGDVWPHQSDPNDYYWHQQKLMNSSEDAIGAIRNLQPYFVESSGWKITSLEIDKYGLRAAGTWSETHNQWVPSSGGFFAGNTYVPVYGGSVQTYSTNRQGAFSISFDDVKLFWLVHFHTISAPYKWGVLVAYKGSTPPVTLRVRSREEATRLISALETLAAQRDYSISSSSMGVDAREPTPVQSAELGLPPGIGMYCRIVFKEGPFERIGLRTGDVVVSIDGHQLRGINGLSHARGGDKEWVVYRREYGSSFKKMTFMANTDRDVLPFIARDPRNPNRQ